MRARARSFRREIASANWTFEILTDTESILSLLMTACSLELLNGCGQVLRIQLSHAPFLGAREVSQDVMLHVKRATSYQLSSGCTESNGRYQMMARFALWQIVASASRLCAEQRRAWKGACVSVHLKEP